MRPSAFEPAPIRWLAVDDGRWLPVGRIWCVGRNYAEHAREMGADPAIEQPFFFAKPLTSLVSAADSGPCEIPYPPHTGELHHEVELVVALARGGRDLDEITAARAIHAIGVGVDLTRRDVQARARSSGRPWDLAKGFDGAAPVGRLHRIGRAGCPAAGPIELAVNDRIQQQGDLAQMILDPARLVARLSREIEILPGDLLMTGTPAGVGPLSPGDRVRARIRGLDNLELVIRPVR